MNLADNYFWGKPFEDANLRPTIKAMQATVAELASASRGQPQWRAEDATADDVEGSPS